MDINQQEFLKENEYLAQTLAFIRKVLAKAAGELSGQLGKLTALMRDMWENTVHRTDDLGRLTEVNQYLAEVGMQSAGCQNHLNLTRKLQQMISSPYFGRFDFAENGSDGSRRVYIGRHNLIDPETMNIYVHDWRAPIASIFYRHELGHVAYEAPLGRIEGEILLKRQYKIQDSRLRYFFDCSVRINDEMLQETLSRNASPQMRSLVETIQKEQDLIIRDTDHQLLMVQGVAGSGKTSIALHRIAFLLYEGMRSNLRPDNVLVISPNQVFSQYISSVLPELGEENVEQITFDEIVGKAFRGRFHLETRDEQLEAIIGSQAGNVAEFRRRNAEFKDSGTFVTMLDRLLRYYACHGLVFEDVYFNGKVLETRQRLKNRFLNNIPALPMAKQLDRMEQVILEQVHVQRKIRRRKLEQIVEKSEGHELEIKSYSRLLSIKEAKVFLARLHKFTRIDFLQVYLGLFEKEELFLKLAQGMELPEEIGEIIAKTRESLQQGQLLYEDCAPLLYLMLKVEGGNLFPAIRQVVIDEAQDYGPMQYEVFNLLFQEASYTILGDIQQSVEKEGNEGIYDDISEILDKRQTIKIFLKKGYRSSYEINTFVRKISKLPQDFIPFGRHGLEPLVKCHKTPWSMIKDVADDITYYLERGYQSVAVICKTRAQAKDVHRELASLAEAKLVLGNSKMIEKGATIIPSYLAKGLEFDAVIVYGADRQHYHSEMDRRLLYIACTRALHHLKISYCGEKSPFLD